MASLQIRTGWPSRKLSPNGRPNRFAKASATRNAKAEAYLATAAAAPRGFKFGTGRLKVTIHAIPPVRRQFDDDNLIAAAKAYLDGIASALAVNDSRFDIQPLAWRDAARPGWLIFEVEGDQ